MNHFLEVEQISSELSVSLDSLVKSYAKLYETKTSLLYH